MHGGKGVLNLASFLEVIGLLAVIVPSLFPFLLPSFLPSFP